MAQEQASSTSPFSRRPAPSRVISPVRPGVTPPPQARLVTPAAGAASLPMAAVAGLVAAAVGAGLWAFVTVLTGYQIGWMAVGVGFVVGWAVRMGGRGTTMPFQILGAGLALFGCLGGNLLTACIVAAGQLEVSTVQMLGRLTPGLMLDLMSATFSPIDLLFYALAVYQGHRFSVVSAAAEK